MSFTEHWGADHNTQDALSPLNKTRQSTKHSGQLSARETVHKTEGKNLTKHSRQLPKRWLQFAKHSQTYYTITDHYSGWHNFSGQFGWQYPEWSFCIMVIKFTCYDNDITLLFPGWTKLIISNAGHAIFVQVHTRWGHLPKKSQTCEHDIVHIMSTPGSESTKDAKSPKEKEKKTSTCT